MKLRDYQAEGFNDVCREWAEGNSVVMYVCATGGGKTVTFVALICRAVLAGRRVLLVAHREELITQAWQTLQLANIYAGIIMGAVPPKPEARVQVASVQTLARRKQLPEAEEVYFDEGHHVQADNTYGRLLKHYAGANILMVTATPYRLSGDGFLNLHPYKRTTLILNRTLPQLVEQGWLVPLDYYVAGVPDLSHIDVSKGDYTEDSSMAAMRMAPLVAAYKEHSAGMQGICFCINVAHSLAVTEQYRRAGIPVAHLDANTPEEERRRIIAAFRRRELLVICNVGILTEGADFPQCEFVQLARPTKSLSLLMQMVGRVTRPLPDLPGQDAGERRRFIALSRKPVGIVLDNAGCYMDHGLPDQEIDWAMHFRGRKKAKGEQNLEEMQMLVYIAETPGGRQIRTTNPQEVEGLRLIKITAENRRKVVNVTSIKEFDRLMAIFKNQRHMKAPAYTAFRGFVDYCRKQNILICDEVWEYLHRRLVSGPRDQKEELDKRRAAAPLSLPFNVYEAEAAKIKRLAVSDTFLKGERTKYEREHESEVLNARFA